MRVYLMIMLMFWMMLFIKKSKAIQIDLNTILECDNLTNTPLVNNPAVFALVLQICLNDARCRDLYGQSIIVDEELFAFLFQTTTEFSLPITFESPIRNVLCGKTVMQSLEILWLMFLKISMLDNDQVCALDAFPVFTNNKLSIKCKDLPSSGNTFESDADNISLTIFVIILILVAIWVPKGIWETYNKMRNQNAIENFLPNIKT